MAVINKLSLTFTTEGGKSATFSYKYAKSGVTSSQVKALMSAMIANNVIFSSKPAIAKSAKLVKTEEDAIDISE